MALGRRAADPLWRAFFLALVLMAVFFLPYHFPVSPTVSRSYVAGFSNRAAVLLLVVGTFLFALFTRGEIAASEEGAGKDSRLSGWALVGGLALTVAACIVRVHIAANGSPGGETAYFLNREQMLLGGLAPYRQFEFVYGPLLLYPNVWLLKLSGLGALRGYVIVWMASWVAGVCMIWSLVRAIDFPVPSRTFLFALLLGSELVWTDYGGLNYTPLRAYAAALCVTATYAVFRRTRSGWMAAAVAVAAVGLALSYSPDQAVGAAVGLMGGMTALAISRQTRFSWAAVAAAGAGMLACFAVASRLGWLKMMGAFASGGYSYPLLPSFSIAVALVSYVAAGCIAFRWVRLGRLDSVVVPLVMSGFALLPSALGRCDMLHITAAIPAFVIGCASLLAMPSLRRWWAIATVVGLIAIPFGTRRSERFWIKAVPGYARLPDVASPDPNPGYQDRNQSYISEPEVPSSVLPCDRRYFSPSLMPLPMQPFRPECLDTGYYLGLVDVITPEAIAAKVAELRSRPTEPLLLENEPLDWQFPILLGDMLSLSKESGSFWLPHRRNAPLTYAPIEQYILEHYAPGPTAAGERLRIWIPNAPGRTFGGG